MGTFNDIRIKDIIEELNQSYFLPDIQREYVWLTREKEKKIEQLFDSILRGYPIGSFLFWKLKRTDIETNKSENQAPNKINFQLYKFIENYDIRRSHNEKIDVEKINSDDLSIVLDGQQRLTSLYIGLKGSRILKKPKARWDNQNSFEEKKLYINLRYKPNNDNPEDNYNFEFLNEDNIPVEDKDTYWFKVGAILSIKSLITYAREYNLNEQEADILDKMQRAFCSERLISYFEETDKSLDKVLKIFIRVNSGGMQLSYSDLLMSILTANFSSDIRDMMNRFVDDLKEKGFEVMQRDQILKTCLILTETNHIFKLKNFSKNNIQKIEDNWGKITDTIYQSVQLLKEFGYTGMLSSAYIISIISLYIYNHDVKNEDKDEMLEFVRNAQITSFFTTSLDNKLSTVIDVMKRSNSFKEFNDILKKEKILNISIQDIDSFMELQYGNPAVLPILQLLYPNLDYKNSLFHIDHIYPKSKYNRNNQNIPEEVRENANYLFNLELLQGEENIIKKAKDPEVWLDEYYKGDSEKIMNYKEQNYIDKNLKLEWKNIPDFKKSREQKIRERLVELLQ